MLYLVIFVKRPIELQPQNQTCSQKFRSPGASETIGAELLLSDWMVTARELGSKCLLVWSASCPGTLCPSVSGAGVLPRVSSELASAPLQILSSRHRLCPCKCVSAVLQSEEPYLWAQQKCHILLIRKKCPCSSVPLHTLISKVESSSFFFFANILGIPPKEQI